MQPLPGWMATSSQLHLGGHPALECFPVSNKTTYTQGDNILILTGNADNLKSGSVFVNFGWNG